MGLNQSVSIATGGRGEGNQRSQRSDGDVTRSHILEVAGQLFAEHGYANTTSKMICQQAQVNIAAVNYHFGSLDQLYQAVLSEVQRRLINIDYLSALADSALPASAKLEAFIDGLVTDLLERHSWHTRLWAREIVDPSPFMQASLQHETLPKFGIIRRLIAEITGLAMDSAAMQRCVHTVMAPCMLLLLVSRELDTPIKPLFQQDAAVVAQHIKIYTLAGLEAVVKLYSAPSFTQ